MHKRGGIIVFEGVGHFEYEAHPLHVQVPILLPLHLAPPLPSLVLEVLELQRLRHLNPSHISLYAFDQLCLRLSLHKLLGGVHICDRAAQLLLTLHLGDP